MRFQCAYLVADATTSYWGQTYHQGDVFVVVEVEAKKDQSTSDVAESDKDTKPSIVSVGRAVLDVAISAITSQQVVDMKSLKEAVDGVFKQMAPSTESTKITVMVAKVISDVLYVLIRGGGRILILREKVLAVIRDSPGSASGILKPGDRLFFFSPQLSQQIEPKILLGFTGFTAQDMAEALTSLLHQQKKMSGVGIVVGVEKGVISQPTDGLTGLSLVEESLAAKKENRLVGIERIRSFIIETTRQITTRFSKVFVSVFLKLRFLFHRDGARRRWWSILLVLVVLFFVSITFGMVKRRQGERNRKLAEVKELTVHEIVEAEALVGINNSRARSLLGQARERLEPLTREFGEKSTEGKEVGSLLRRIKDLEVQAARIYHLSSVPVFYDLTLVKSEGAANDAALYQSNLVVLDFSNRSVYMITLAQKRAEIVTGGEKLSTAKLVAVHGERVFVLTDEGIVASSIRGEQTELVIPTDSDWGVISDMEAFAGNVYLLDSSGNQIWKYPATDTGLGEKVLWLPDDSTHKFTERTRMAIDGAIWTITEDRIDKFIQGKLDGSFQVSGFDEALSSDTAIYTDDEVNFLYVLDRGNKRVVVFDKDGRYQAQYQWDGIGEAVLMVVSKEEGKILLLEGSTIYGVDIKS